MTKIWFPATVVDRAAPLDSHTVWVVKDEEGYEMSVVFDWPVTGQMQRRQEPRNLEYVMLDSRDYEGFGDYEGFVEAWKAPFAKAEKRRDASQNNGADERAKKRRAKPKAQVQPARKRPRPPAPQLPAPVPAPTPPVPAPPAPPSQPPVARAPSVVSADDTEPVAPAGTTSESAIAIDDEEIEDRPARGDASPVVIERDVAAVLRGVLSPAWKSLAERATEPYAELPLLGFDSEGVKRLRDSLDGAAIGLSSGPSGLTSEVAIPAFAELRRDFLKLKGDVWHVVTSASSHLIDIAPVGDDDPRVGLRGQSKAVAKRPLDTHQVLGVYYGRTMLEREYEDMHSSSPATLHSHERYAFSFECKGVDCVIDALDRGNFHLMAINDARRAPHASRARGLSASERSAVNVTFRAALLDGFPITSITALKPIKQGDELLIDYGKDFWLKNFGLDRYIAQFQHPALVSLHAQLSRHLAQDLG